MSASRRPRWRKLRAAWLRLNRKPWWNTYFPLGTLGAALLLWATGFVVYAAMKAGSDGPGTLGDTFGVLTSLFTAISFWGLLLTLWYQRVELALQRKELQLQRAEIALNREELRRGAEAQIQTSRFIEQQLLIQKETFISEKRAEAAVECRRVIEHFYPLKDRIPAYAKGAGVGWADGVKFEPLIQLARHVPEVCDDLHLFTYQKSLFEKLVEEGRRENPRTEDTRIKLETLFHDVLNALRALEKKLPTPPKA